MRYVKGFYCSDEPTENYCSSLSFCSILQRLSAHCFDCEAHNFIVLVQSLRFHCIGSTQQADVLSEKALKPHVAAQQLKTNGPHKVSDIF